MPKQAVETNIVLLRGPIHYDLLIPLTPNIREEFAFLGEQGIPVFAPEAEWLIVGWGAKSFYTQTGGYADISAKPILRGIFGDSSVLRFDVLGNMAEVPGQVWLGISQGQLDQLIHNIFAEMAEVTPIDTPGFNATDVFYPAKTRFHIFRTCNVWIGSQLRRINIRFGRWTPTPYSVTISAWLWAD